MSRIVDMKEVKTLLPLVSEVEAGAEIVLARDGTPIARLVPVHAKQRRLGQWKGNVRMSRDFDAPLSLTALAAFEGRK